MGKYFAGILSFLLFAIILLHPASVLAQSSDNQRQLEGVVTTIQSEQERENNGQKQMVQQLEVLITEGSDKGKKITVETGSLPSVVQTIYKVGDKVMVTANNDIAGKTNYFIADFVRHDALYILFAIFLLVVFVIAGKRGAFSFLGMIFSFVVIFTFLLPQISSGQDPVLIAILASCAIIPVTFFLSHGINAKTSIAIFSTLIALVITGILSTLFVDAAKLTGFSSDEAAFLANMQNGTINMKDLLLAGIIIGALGILDDITIAQSALIFQLKKASHELSLKELFMRGMDVGRDHIASMVNTLILIYTGAALPLLLLFMNNPQPFHQVLNYELIAEEIVRTLVASIGLILAVPITTILAAIYCDLQSIKAKKVPQKKK